VQEHSVLLEVLKDHIPLRLAERILALCRQTRPHTISANGSQVQ
jgi:hypothetical protein